MKLSSLSSIAVAGLLVFLSVFSELGVCRDDALIRMNLGGFKDSRGSQNSAESIGLFAVQEHNKQQVHTSLIPKIVLFSLNFGGFFSLYFYFLVQNGVLEFGRVLNSREQVVAGKIYHLTLEAFDAGIKKIYEAKVWVKPWINFKQLQEFKFSHDVPSFTSSDLGLKRGKLTIPFLFYGSKVLQIVAITNYCLGNYSKPNLCSQSHCLLSNYNHAINLTLV